MTKHQQPIVFDSQPDEPDKAQILQQQQLFDQDVHWESADAEGGNEVLRTELGESSNKPNYWLWALGLLGIGIGIETLSFFYSHFFDSPISSSLFLVALAILLTLSGRQLWRELGSLKQLKRRDKRRKQAERLLLSAQKGEAEGFCQGILDDLPQDMARINVDDWYQSMAQTHSDKEMLELFSMSVLKSVDEKAYRLVTRFATEASVLVALSPLAIMDMAIVCWRNLRLVRQIARLYGMELGYWSRVRLIKELFSNIVYAGASEIVMDLGMDALNAELSTRLSGRLAQGMGAGVLTARLGLKTMALCRPVPAPEKSEFILAKVRKGVLSELLSLVKKQPQTVDEVTPEETSKVHKS